MQKQNIYVTEFDLERITGLLSDPRYWDKEDREFLGRLEKELDYANAIPSQAIPEDVVTMNSQVHVRDLDSGKEMIITLVFPSEANYREGKISILSPIGATLFGCRAGDRVESKVPGGIRRLNVEKVLYQPEAMGNYHL